MKKLISPRLMLLASAIDDAVEPLAGHVRLYD